MKTKLLILVICVLFKYSNAQNNCGTDIYYKNEKLKIQKELRYESKIPIREKIVIPVVVHIIYNSYISNISDNQVYSQIEALNRDFNKLNADTAKIPEVFKSYIADCEISFELARKNPEGNYTSGITRTYTNKSYFLINSDEAKFDSLGGRNIWDRNKYLNIWVVPEIQSNDKEVLAYAQYPGGDKETDGIVIKYSNFGTKGVINPKYNKGRTAVHEVGHWLNLYHIWGDDNGACNGSDFVDDTPNQAGANYDCPVFPSSSCFNYSDMFMNYMDYVNDDCMQMFTKGQKERMLYTLHNSRKSLLASDALDSIKDNIEQSLFYYPNPAKSALNIKNDDFIKIKIYDIRGSLMIEKSAENDYIILNINDLQNGVYFIKAIKNDNSTYIGKVLVLN